MALTEKLNLREGGKIIQLLKEKKITDFNKYIENSVLDNQTTLTRQKRIGIAVVSYLETMDFGEARKIADQILLIPNNRKVEIFRIGKDLAPKFVQMSSDKRYRNAYMSINSVSESLFWYALRFAKFTSLSEEKNNLMTKCAASINYKN